MALTLRASFPTNTGASPQYADYPSDLAVDDLMLLQVTTANDVVPVVPGGFQLIAEITGTFRTGIYQKIADAYDVASLRSAVSWASGNGTVGVVAINSTTLAYPAVHQVAVASSAVASANKVWTGVTNADANTLLLCFGGFGTSASSTPHAGMTERWDASSPRIYLMTEAIAASGATGTRTATGTSVASQKCITISITETNVYPIPGVLWGLWDEPVGSLSVSGPAPSINTVWSAVATAPGSTVENRNILIIPPPQARNVKVRVDWIITVTKTGGIANSAGSISTDKPVTLTQTGGVSGESFPTSGGVDSGSNTVEWDFPGYATGDWPTNTADYIAVPPATPDAAACIVIERVMSASAGHTITVDFDVTVTLIEITFDSGTIWGPQVVVTELPVLLELEGEGIQITQMGVFAEISALGIYTTEFPVYAEIAAIGIYLTSFPMLVELEEFTPEVAMPTSFPRTDGTRAMHKLLPEEITGYAFDPDFSWWSTIVAEKSTNMINNPSFEWLNDLDIATQYDEGGSLTSLDYVEFPAVGATAGRRCARLISGASSGWITYDEGLAVTPGPYTFSCDVYVTRLPFHVTLHITGTGGATAYVSRVFHAEATGWFRYAISYVELGSGNRECRLTLPNTNPSGVTVYTDAWQFEAKAYPTTYFDGDNIGFNDVRPFQSYYWHGEPHQSPSTRLESTGSGGRIVSWGGERIGFNTTAIVGLDMTTVEVETQELGDGREIHRSSNPLARNFTIVGRIFAGDARDLMNRKNRLVSLFKPNNTLDGEQIVVRYQQADDEERLVGPPLDIVCAYSDGLQGNMTNFYQEALAFQFHASQSSVREVIDSSAEILLNKTLIENQVFFRDADGDYVNLGTGVTSGGSILGIGFARDGSPVAVGSFTQIAGDAIARAARWDGSDWVEYGSPASGLQFLDDGRKLGYEPAAVYDAASIAIYTELGSLWTELGDPFLGAIYALDRDTDGNIWVGGEFETDDPAVVTYNNVAKWNYDLEVWETLGDGLTDPGILNPDLRVNTVLATNDGYVYFGGWFEQGDGVAATTFANSAIRWNIATQEYEGMGTGLNAAPNKFVQGQDGFIYAVGEFDQNGTEIFDIRGFGRYNGYEWEEVFPLQRVDGTYGADGVTIDENGVFWFYGYGSSFPDDYFDIPELGQVGTFGWKDGTFYPPFADVTLREMVVGPGDVILYNGFGIVGDDVIVPALNTIDYPGTADAPLAFFLDGPAHPVQVINRQTKGGIYFKHTFDLGNMEKMVARSDAQKSIIYSNARPNLFKFLSAGISSLKALRLRPGINRLSVFVTGEGETTLAWITWRNRYQAISGPVED